MIHLKDLTLTRAMYPTLYSLHNYICYIFVFMIVSLFKGIGIISKQIVYFMLLKGFHSYVNINIYTLRLFIQ